MKKLIILIILFTTLSASKISSILNTQTALFDEEKTYNINFTVYNMGGVNLRAGLTINSRFVLGVNQFVDNLIGYDNGTWYIPGVFLKIGLLDNPPESFNLAVSYDSFFNGSIKEYNGISYGISIINSKGFYLFSDLPHIVSLGIRFPLIPKEIRNFNEVNIFISSIFRITKFLNINFELLNIYFTPNHNYTYLLNSEINYSISDSLSVILYFELFREFNTEKLFNNKIGRILRISYLNLF